MSTLRRYADAGDLVLIAAAWWPSTAFPSLTGRRLEALLVDVEDTGEERQILDDGMVPVVLTRTALALAMGRPAAPTFLTILRPDVRWAGVTPGDRAGR